MTSHSSPRRLLLIAAVVAALALAPQAEARVHPSAHTGSAARLRWVEDTVTATLDSFWHRLQSVWAQAGSGLDPLGNH